MLWGPISGDTSNTGQWPVWKFGDEAVAPRYCLPHYCVEPALPRSGEKWPSACSPPPNSMAGRPWAGGTLSPGVKSPRAIILIVLEGLRAERASRGLQRASGQAVRGAAPAAVRPPTFCLLHQPTGAPFLAWHPTCRLQDTGRGSNANRDHGPPELQTQQMRDLPTLALWGIRQCFIL